MDSFVDLPAEVGSLLCCLMILMMFETDKITWWNRHKTEWIKKLIDLLSIIKVQIYREHATINHFILKSQKRVKRTMLIYNGYVNIRNLS